MPPGENSRDFRTVLFMQHPAKNALDRASPSRSFVACAECFSNLFLRRRGASRSRPVFQFVAYVPRV